MILSEWSTCRKQSVLLASKQSLFFFSGALFEENFAKDVFLFLMRIVVLDVVVVGLVKHTVRVVIAIRVFVSNAAGQRNSRVR